jgi:hypothetical protein
MAAICLTLTILLIVLIAIIAMNPSCVMNALMQTSASIVIFLNTATTHQTHGILIIATIVMTFSDVLICRINHFASLIVN